MQLLEWNWSVFRRYGSTLCCVVSSIVELYVGSGVGMVGGNGKVVKS